MENKTSKYLKYAIGEIILVVIGILIALQLNNWNENRKIKEQQMIFLANTKQDLSNDLVQLDEIIKHQTQKLNLTNTLIKELTSEKKDFKTIERLFSKGQNTPNYTFFANTGAYTTSGSSGILDNLKPEELKISITTLYERFYKRLIYNGEVYDSRNDEIAVNRGKFFNKLNSTLNDETVIYNSEFLNFISVAVYNNSNYVTLCNTTKKEIEKTLSQINRALQ